MMDHQLPERIRDKFQLANTVMKEDYVMPFELSDWIILGILGINFVALIVNTFSVWKQSTAINVNHYLTLLEKLSEAWRRYRDVPDTRKEEKDYEFFETLNLFEAASHLYRKRAIRGVSRDLVRDYLKEIIRGIYANCYAKSLLESSHSGPHTYEHIKWFSCKYKLIPNS